MEIPSHWYWREEKRHFVSELKDGDEVLIIYKRWLKSKQRWDYRIEPRGVIELEISLMARDRD